MRRNNPPDLLQDAYLAISELRGLVGKLCEAAAVIHGAGWAEANAGNVSLRISDLIQPFWLAAGYASQYPCTEWFLVSRSGSRYREMVKNPLEALMLIGIGTTQHFFPKAANPTSEWDCHYKLHQLYAGRGLDCLLHTHPTEIIALSSTKEYQNQDTLNATLFSLLPELSIFLPAGIATAPFAEAGSSQLAETSRVCMNDKQVLIWEKHGLIALAEDPDKALDYTEVVNKAAKLYFLIYR